MIIAKLAKGEIKQISEKNKMSMVYLCNPNQAANLNMTTDFLPLPNTHSHTHTLKAWH